MPINRTRSTAARSALALGTLTAALVLSPVAVSAAQAAPAHHGAVTETTARAAHCYRTIGGGADDPGHVGVRISHYCGGHGQA
ncbi:MULTISPECIES: hypothetical protein [Clavibacter]|uniref:Uncharacterized protein n=2 Tax=Clavibacter TaxID=1573 RepID=A0A399NW32_9MICO|nr:MULTISPECIES: hypothetical protein [Clavibacter]KDP92603.1 hypothetical protein W824_01170 [Clavibacter cf. michiganensis LMG 26808]RII98011.1 hypothetical protein DZF96_04840 [Clavibacter michiganensis]UKF25285.1 hypothetical protein KYT88_00905 [Clavibacter sp. A6099]